MSLEHAQLGSNCLPRPLRSPPQLGILLGTIATTMGQFALLAAPISEAMRGAAVAKRHDRRHHPKRAGRPPAQRAAGYRFRTQFGIVPDGYMICVTWHKRKILPQAVFALGS
jgi:hypothetical protein